MNDEKQIELDELIERREDLKDALFLADSAVNDAESELESARQRVAEIESELQEVSAEIDRIVMFI